MIITAENEGIDIIIAEALPSRLKIFNLGFEMRVNIAKMEQVKISRIKLQKKFLRVFNNIESDFSLKWTVNKSD